MLTAKISAIVNEKIEIRGRCKGVHCVDLDESFPTHIFLQNFASIQPRASPVFHTTDGQAGATSRRTGTTATTITVQSAIGP